MDNEIESLLLSAPTFPNFNVVFGRALDSGGQKNQHLNAEKAK